MMLGSDQDWMSIDLLLVAMVIPRITYLDSFL
jgi:hypothetical protein